MTLNQRLKLLIIYYIVVWVAIGFSVYYDVFAAQSLLVETPLTSFIQLKAGELTHLAMPWVMALCFLFSILPAVILLTFKNKASFFILLFVLICGGVGWWVGLQDHHIIFPVVYTVGSFLIGVIVAVFLKMIYSSAEKDFLRAAFTQFVSEDMLKELLRDPDKLRLTGKEYNITVLFLDIRGFTAFSEKKSPAVVVTRLNELLNIVTHIIIDNDGTVDKYIGDAVMAFWGAPAADKKQATKALKAALEVRKKINEETDFNVGVGINYGKAIIGNIGSSKRFDYTAIGDTVNTASRIESLTKSLGQSIVVSESVMDKLKNENGYYETEDLGQVLVKGKNIKLHVFGLK